MGNALVWLRDDLRLADNPALVAGIAHAQGTGGKVTLVYVFDEESPGIRPLGAATKWWLHHSLKTLSVRARALGGNLILRRGEAFNQLEGLARETEADGLFWNRRYGGAERAIDARVKSAFSAEGRVAQSFHANVLFEPWTIRSGAGTPYTVFTPFWKACLGQQDPVRAPLDTPADLLGMLTVPVSESLQDWNLLPRNPDWSEGLAGRWTPGEIAAEEKLDHFLEHRLTGYATGRDFPAEKSTSELSPHIRFGEISPFQIFAAVDRVAGRLVARDDEAREGIRRFRAEIGWREFSYHLLFHWPDLATVNFDSRFDHFEWSTPDANRVSRWQQGTTGISLVDAGMRELWQTGYMHNRVRMVAASFLIKNLLIDWRIGEAWFWDTLVDADPANNAASWQWVAGCGADAAPYFRVFNPELQAEKFDPSGAYRRKYLGDYESDENYPEPMIVLGESRASALEAFASVSGRAKQVRPPLTVI